METFRNFLLKKLEVKTIDNFSGLRHDSYYGYWIAEDGKIYTVDFFDHSNVLHYLKDQYASLKKLANSTGMAYSIAGKAGWIRIVTERKHMDVLIHKKSVAKPAFQSFVKLANAMFVESYRIEIGTESYAVFDDPKPAANFIRNHIRS